MKNIFCDLKANQKGVALIFTLMVTTILMILAFAMISITTADTNSATAQEKKKIAQYVAEGALEGAKQQMYDAVTDNDPTTNPLDSFEGSDVINGETWNYTCTKTELGSNLYRLAVNATNENDAVKDLSIVVELNYGEPVQEVSGTRTVTETVYQTVYTAGQSVFSNALVLGPNNGQTINLTGQMDIRGSLYANAPININDRHHSHGVDIEGNVSSTGTVTGNVHAVDGHVRQNQPPITMPVVDSQYIYQLAMNQHTSADPTVFSGNQTLTSNSFNDGSAYYIDGDLTIVGEISGTVLIYATGNITVKGNINITHSDYDSHIPRAAGLIAGKNVYFVSTVDGHRDDHDNEHLHGPQIRGFVIAGQTFNLTGEGEIEGTLIAQNVVINNTGEHNVELRINREHDHHGHHATPANNVISQFGSQIFSNYSSLATRTVRIPSSRNYEVNDYIYAGGELEFIKYKQWEEIN
jgi:cytoskeletal protein CcmA (bactofilin family)